MHQRLVCSSTQEKRLVIGDLNHLYRETHAPLRRQIYKEIEVEIEARAEKAK